MTESVEPAWRTQEQLTAQVPALAAVRDALELSSAEAAADAGARQRGD